MQTESLRVKARCNWRVEDNAADELPERLKRLEPVLRLRAALNSGQTLGGTWKSRYNSRHAATLGHNRNRQA